MITAIKNHLSYPQTGDFFFVYREFKGVALKNPIRGVAPEPHKPLKRLDRNFSCQVLNVWGKYDGSLFSVVADFLEDYIVPKILSPASPRPGTI